ncbi:MAG: hypothetical protein QOI57_3134 [Rubrobacteraceae bacterium]|nr:hypothetical protein [Rubrobacteraceae bacterium]
MEGAKKRWVTEVAKVTLARVDLQGKLLGELGARCAFRYAGRTYENT